MSSHFQWQEFFSKFSDGERQWGFVPPGENLGTIPYPITLRTGDYNMDGLPDAIVFLRTKDKEHKLVIFLSDLKNQTIVSSCVTHILPSCGYFKGQEQICFNPTSWHLVTYNFLRGHKF